MDRIKANEIRSKMVIKVDNGYYRVISSSYNQNCQREPVISVVLSDIYTGNKKETRFGAHDDVFRIHITEKKGTYSYKDGDMCCILDNENFELLEIPSDKINKPEFLVSNCPVLIASSEDIGLIGVDIEQLIEAEIIESQDSDKHKKAILETGHAVTVPAYVMRGDKIVINTETGEFVKRV